MFHGSSERIYIYIYIYRNRVEAEILYCFVHLDYLIVMQCVLRLLHILYDAVQNGSRVLRILLKLLFGK